MRTGSPKIKTLAAANRAAADAAALDLWRRYGEEVEHLSSRGIAEELNRRGVPTPRGGPLAPDECRPTARPGTGG